MNRVPDKKWFLLICAALALLTFAAFEGALRNDFTNYDDDAYITNNPNVQAGLTAKTIKWAFTEPHYFMWHPLTSLSHILDYQLFKLNPRGHHLTSLLFHIANVLLLFSVLKTMTGRLWPSAFVAAVFALHPLNVESVAWVAERKTVLSGFFWLLTIASYIRYAKNPLTKNYLLMIFVFACALMSKPTSVTLPFALLLLDYWPLNRIQDIKLTNAPSRQIILSLIREKIPLFFLSALCSIITFLSQKGGGVVVGLTNLPLNLRLANSVFSYSKYIGKMIWPKDLAVFYQYTGDYLTSVWVLVVFAFLLVVSIRVIQFAPKYRYFPVGWFWFIGTLVPVLGIVQVGSQALADRYTYVPLIGLFIITAWGAADFSAKLPYRKVILGILALTVLAALTICTRTQVRYWKNSVILFEHALRVTKNNSGAHYNLGTTFASQGRFDDALEHYKKALQIIKRPDSDILYNMGCVYNSLGRYSEAIDAFKQTIEAKPDFVEAYTGLGHTFGMLGRHAEAEQACKQAIKLKPDSADAHFTLGAAYFSQKLWSQATEAFKQVIRINPDYIQAYYNLGLALSKAGDVNGAIQQYEILQQLDPRLADALLKEIQK